MISPGLDLHPNRLAPVAEKNDKLNLPNFVEGMKLALMGIGAGLLGGLAHGLEPGVRWGGA